MENKAHALIAGALVVIITALLAVLAIWLTRVAYRAQPGCTK
jgi:phospholipid/cholesterol/gamma-HCH transport system substrate-binding protein